MSTINHTTKYLQSVIDGIPDPVLVIGRDFAVSFMNQEARTALGADALSRNGLKCYQIHHDRQTPCNAANEPCPLVEVFKTGKPVKAYHRHGGPGGEQKIIEVSASPLFGEEGEVVGIVEALRQIPNNAVAHLLKASEERLRASREALVKEHAELSRVFKLVEIAKREWEKTMDCVEDMVILTDMQGRVKRCNKSFKEFMGRAYDELLGKDCIELLAGNGIEVHELHGRETEVIHRPAERWYRVRSYPASGIYGPEVSGSVITIHDITDIKLMNRKLEQSNQEIEENRLSLQHALDELSALIQRVETEQAFSVRYSNPNIKKCYELKNCEKTDCPCYGKEALRCWQIAGTHCGGCVQGEFAQKYRNCIECAVFKAASPNPIYHIGEHFNNMMNILELKNRELGNAYSELKLTQTKILQQEKMASIGQLAAGVAHEINNPMAFISSNLGTMRKYLDRIFEYMHCLANECSLKDRLAADERLADARKRLNIDAVMGDAKKLIAESLEGADRVKTIVKNLKSFSHVDQAEMKAADLNDCVESTLNIVWNELKYKATVKKEYGVLPRTQCYPQQMNQVFMNLLVNAAHAIEKQGEITIRTWHRDGSIFASVSDTGTGIPEQNLSRIFEPFFTTKEVGKGTGLGLSITYDIIKKHDGDITVKSDVGRGTTFTVKIPFLPGEQYE
jgi:PAS domain S-box-containing protein